MISAYHMDLWRELREKVALVQVTRFEQGKESWTGKWTAGGLYANALQDSDTNKLLKKISLCYID